MSRARNVVQNLTSNPHYPTEDLTKDEYINMKSIPRLGHTNVAYAGYINADTTWQHHHYEDPSAMSQLEILSNSSHVHRKRNNELYEPTGPLQSRKLFLGSLDKHSSGDLVESGKDSCLNRLVLFLILVVSVTALVLVVLLIMGFIGHTCVCTARGTKQQLIGTRSVVSLEPVEDEIARMKANMTTLHTMLVREMKTTNDIQTKLDSAILVIEGLRATINHTGTPDQDLQNLEIKINSTNIKLEEEVARRLGLEEKANDTSKKLAIVADDVKMLENAMYRRMNQTEGSLNQIGLALNETVIQQYQAVVQKVNANSQELRTANQDLYRSIMEINRTLIDKVENVSKMIGPMGPRGYNGTQGPWGPPGLNGTRGIQGPWGLNGSQGLVGPQGIPGPAGAGNLSQCEYKKDASPPSSPGSFATNSIYVAEPAGKRIMGVYCDTDRAALVKMDYLDSGGVRKYSCLCYGDSSYISLSSTMTCFISYWQCPRYT